MRHKRQGRNLLCFWPRLCVPDLLDTPIEYSTISNCAVYSLNNVREISLRFESESDSLSAPFTSRLRLSLFRYGADSDLCKYNDISTVQEQSYIYKLRQILRNGRMSSQTDSSLDESDGNMEDDLLNIDDGQNNNYDDDGISNLRNIEVVSGIIDSNYGDNMKKSVNELSKLYQFITSRLPSAPPSLVPPMKNPYNNSKEDIEANRQNYTMNENINDAYIARYSNITCASRKFYMTTRLNNISIVSKNRNIEVPESWINIQEGEDICGTYGEFDDKLHSSFEVFLDCISFGEFYKTRLRNRRAFILTTKRLIVVVVDGKDGVIPLSDRGCKVDVRSLYFGSSGVKSGYITSNNPERQLETGIWTDAGLINLRFKDVPNALLFVKLMHQSCNRLGDENGHINLKTAFRDMFDRTGTYLQHRSRMDLFNERQAHPHRINNPDIIPMMDGESILDCYNGQVVYNPFGSSTCLLNIMNKTISLINYIFERDIVPKANYVCSKRFLGVCWPLVPGFFSCGSFPHTSLSEVVVTDYTVFHINRTAPYGGLCVCDDACIIYIHIYIYIYIGVFVVYICIYVSLCLSISISVLC